MKKLVSAIMAILATVASFLIITVIFIVVFNWRGNSTLKTMLIVLPSLWAGRVVYAYFNNEEKSD